MQSSHRGRWETRSPGKSKDGNGADVMRGRDILPTTLRKMGEDRGLEDLWWEQGKENMWNLTKMIQRKLY